MADHNWSYMFFQVGVLVEIGPIKGFLMAFYAVLMVILSNSYGT